MDEEWRDIPGYEGLYQVSNMGRVKSLKGNEKILKLYSRRGYLGLNLHKNTNVHLKAVHRLVAESFLGNYPNLQVNHKDGNKHNNIVENLEWVTPSQNIIHAYNHGLHRRKYKVDIYTKDGKYIIQVESVREAKEWIQTNTKFKKANDGSISKVCNGKLYSSYGYIFRYPHKII
jgi:hypothetical protein